MSWYSKYLSVYEKSFDEVAFKDIIAEVREKLKNQQSESPLVTVSVIAYNEEKHLLACLWALSEMQTRYPIEIIGVDNDSSDRTADVFKALELPYFSENRHSCGYARSCGLSHAKGKYHVNIDADTLYPAKYVDMMIDVLEKDSTIMGVSGSWAYFPDEAHSAIGLFFYVKMRDFYLWIQSWKRPELSVRGLVFVYRTEYARKVGIRVDIIRGEDGALAFGLRKYGKIAFLRNAQAKAITGYGTVGNGSLLLSLWKRILQALKKGGSIFFSAKKYKDRESNMVKNK